MSKLTLEVSEEEMSLVMAMRERDKPKLWEPSGEDNNYFTSVERTAKALTHPNKTLIKSGCYSATEEQAEQKLDRNITNNLIQTWVNEMGGYKWERGNRNCFLMYDGDDESWYLNHNTYRYNPSVVYMSEKQASTLIEGLNKRTIDIGFKGVEK